MNVQQAELYQRIQAFSLDDSDADLPFSKRLAQDNGWSAKYTQLAIAEYKKFVFLAVATGHPVTPSDQVDQVWHLHLLYTRSYWGEFCPNVLQMPLHHGPTRGGYSEHRKHNNWYDKTLASYESFFGQTPPADIWPPAHIRFGRDVHFKRVNVQQTWLLPKPHLELLSKLYLKRPAIVTLLFLLVLTVTGCEPLILGNIRNPLDFKGPEFLEFYIWLASTVILFACFLRWYLRQPADNPSQVSVSLNTYETAYLAAGEERAVDTAIASLVQRGHLKPEPELRTLVIETPLPINSHSLEQAIEQAVRMSGGINQVRTSVAYATNRISNHLQDLGLLMTKNQASSAQYIPAVGVFLLLLLGINKILIGISRSKPVGILVVLCIITAIIGFWFISVPVVQRSRYGDRMLADLHARHAHLGKSTTSRTLAESELALAFALFGTGVLAGSLLTDLRQVLIPPPSSGSSGCSGGGSSGCSGGGCGGGGCGGGCGGCGGG